MHETCNCADVPTWRAWFAPSFARRISETRHAAPTGVHENRKYAGVPPWSTGFAPSFAS